MKFRLEICGVTEGDPTNLSEEILVNDIENMDDAMLDNIFVLKKCFSIQLRVLWVRLMIEGGLYFFLASFKQ